MTPAAKTRKGYYKDNGRFIPEPNRGERHHRAKLTADQVREMRRLNWEVGVCIRCLSKIYGVKYPTAWDAINCVTWRSI